MAAKKLTLKQQKFISKYMELGNATQAYKEVYGVSQKSAEKSGPRLSENVGVKAEIERRRNLLKEKAEKKEFNTLEAFMHIYKVCTQQEKIKKAIKGDDGEIIEIETIGEFDASGANTAAKNAGQIQGDFEKDNDQKNKIKVEHELSEKQLEAIASLKNFLQ